MNALVGPVVWLLGLALASQTGAATKSGSWEKLYQVSTPGRWLTSVWQKDDGTWRAGGKDLIVSGNEKGIGTSDIDGFVVYAFGEDASGGLVAVGSRQGIWEEKNDGFVRVHERPGPPLKGRAAHGDILQGLGYLDPERPDRLVAYGSLHLAISRDPKKPWQVSDDERLAKRGSLGPEPKPPVGCHAAGWWWLSRTDGLLTCHEGAAYLYTGTTATSVGRLPKACLRRTVAVARDGRELVVACGVKARIWRNEVGATVWSEVPGVSDVHALHARKGCLLVLAGRTVLRQCTSGSLSPKDAK